MTITSSIVTYNTDRDELTDCLQLLQHAGMERIYVVDNSPTDRLRKLVESSGKTVEYIHLPQNPGYGAAHNVALRKALDAGTRYHLVVNSDIVFDPKIIGLLVEFMDRNPNAALVQPRIVSPDGSEQYSTRLIPTPLDLIGRRFLPKALMRARNRRYLLMNRPSGRTLNIPYMQGSFMFFRLEALRTTGLFDERFFMYPEDIDISRRLHRHYSTLYWPEVTVVHAHRGASYRSLRMLWIHMTNMAKYFNKWGWFIDLERRRVNRRILRDLRDLRD